eukprot:TRINITY_DN31927_c0_g1_i1.p2 TRINITY_DN31927_c0_g1~~TRINITY_DN31927_c0_g1_i1.p2  ORF type:complete len:134 (-),score=36.73 TRINITY_DN31927_c0_g1_i1:28-396(-)
MSIESKRRPVALQSSKGKGMRMYKPKFTEEFDYRRDYDPDRQRAEERKLKSQVKQEKRATARELRKDAKFLARERDQERAEEDAERTAKYKELMHGLEQQAADSNTATKRFKDKPSIADIVG